MYRNSYAFVLYGDYKKLLKQLTGIALKYPYLTPGSDNHQACLDGRVATEGTYQIVTK